MTPAERAVLARYPDAECWRRDNGYTVFEATPASGGWSGAAWMEPSIIGTGPTPDAAWSDAAARLTTEGE